MRDECKLLAKWNQEPRNMVHMFRSDPIGVAGELSFVNVNGNNIYLTDMTMVIVYGKDRSEHPNIRCYQSYKIGHCKYILPDKGDEDRE